MNGDWSDTIGYIRFPWEEWTDGQEREVRRGVHFVRPVEYFRNGLRRKGRALGMKVRTRGGAEGTVRFQFLVDSQRSASSVEEG